VKDSLARAIPAYAPDRGVVFDRFQIVEELGSGAFGRVLLCRDLEGGEVVAFKELHRVGPDALLRFKREFRVLADVQHPNLVRLGELLEDEGRWGFSLEYVPGHDALSWVRTAMNDPEFDEGRLRRLVAQLLTGLSAIHALGILHRDIKPANIRVGPDERVVLLDFGLAVHLAGGKQSAQLASVGTVAYMAPEQANGDTLTAAADLYAVGALLYEALTGSLPFDGSAMQVLFAKAKGLPNRPAAIASGVPLDLDALCMGLLATKPAERLTCEAALTLLERGGSKSLPAAPMSLRAGELFVGRKEELIELRACHERAEREGFRMVLVEGESGIGKTAVMQRFASELAAEDGKVLVLAGRCHAAEQLAYKVFDGVVDELSRYLMGLAHDACAKLLPEDAHLLAVLFPVLARVPAIGRARRGAGHESVERYPLFDTFMELLRRLSQDRKVVLLVDDLQWADEASLTLLKLLLDTPRAPKLLLVGTARPLAALDDAVGEGLRALASHAHASRVILNGLGEAETRTLTARLAGESDDAALVSRLARESEGHPLFATELVRHARESVGPALNQGLDAALLTRVSKLDVLARYALDLSCVAGGPLPSSVLRTALGKDAERLREVLGALRIERLLRADRRHETVVYHDRIREAVLLTLSAKERQHHHRTLAEAWQKTDAAEPARVAHHWLQCGEHELAAPWLERAAKKAEGGGAYERAIEHYRALLGLEIERSPAEVHTLRIALSDALASAGRCTESARLLLEALAGADEAEAPELAIRAAQRLLQAAQVHEGLAAAERAFDLLGLAWPKTRARAVARLLWTRARIALRGLNVHEAVPDTVSTLQRAELDALRRLTLPLGWADMLRSAELGSRHSYLALACGEPGHAAYALSSEGGMRALRRADAAAIDAVFDKAQVFRGRAAESAELEAYETFSRGMAALCAGNFHDAEAHLEASERVYRTGCPGAVWELSNARGLLLNAWFWRGKLRQLAENAQCWLDEAALRGDRFALATYSVAGLSCYRHLLTDTPERALVEVDEAMAPWRSETVGMQHYMEAFVRAALFSYQGGEGAVAYWAEHAPQLEKSFLFRMPVMREGLSALRIGTVLATTNTQGCDEDALREARRVLRVLRNTNSATGLGWTAFWGAQIAALEGDRARAASLAREASERFDQTGWFHARYAAVLAGHMEGASDASDREQRLLDWLRGEGFIKPEKALFWLLPVARTWR